MEVDLDADIMVSVRLSPRLMLMLDSIEDTIVGVCTMEVVYTMEVDLDADIMVSVRLSPRLMQVTMVDTMEILDMLDTMVDTMVDTPILLMASMDKDQRYQNGHGQPTTFFIVTNFLVPDMMFVNK